MWPEKQGTVGQEEKMLSNTAPEGKPGQLFGPGDKPSRPFLIDKMHLQLFPERGSRDQTHRMNRKRRPHQGEI